MDELYQKTEWNGGDFKNLRIHQILEGLTECAITQRLHPWLMLLQRLNLELYGFESEQERLETEEELKHIAETINNHIRVQIIKKRKTLGVPPDIVNMLNQFEYKLRIIFNRSGLETRLMDDASKALR